MYNCEKCSKKFEKRKAYIGHCSSHNRIKKEKAEKIHTCKYCDRIFDSGIILGGHTGSCILNENRFKKLEGMRKSHIGRIMDDKTKTKISNSMKLAHSENRAWNIGQNRKNNKQSWPEIFFSKFLQNNSISYESEYSIGRFSIDFAIIEKKLAIEIDGKQHYENIKQIESDIKKNELLLNNGWKLLRVKWKTLFNNTDFILKEVIEWIENPSEFKKLE